MKIKSKLIIAFVTPILFIGLFSLIGFIWNRALFVESAEVIASKERIVATLSNYNNELSNYPFIYLKFHDTKTRTEFNAVVSKVKQLENHYALLPSTQEEKNTFDSIVIKLDQATTFKASLFDLIDQQFKLIQSGRDLTRNNILPILDQWEGTFNQNIKTSLNEAAHEKLLLLQEIEASFTNLISNIRYYLLDNTDKSVKDDLIQHNKELSTELTNLSKTSLNQQETLWLNQLNNDYKLFITNINDKEITNNKINALIEKDNALSSELDDLLNNKLYATEFNHSQEIKNTIITMNYVISFILVLFIAGGILLALLFTNYLIKPIEYLKYVIKKIRAGSNVTIKRQSKDEIGDLSDAFSNLIEENRTHTQTLSGQNWLKEHVADILKEAQLQSSLENMCTIVINKLSELLKAGCGAFYILINDEHEPYLKLLGSYSYVKRKKISNHFKLGESLVGQAAFEGKTIILTDVPDDYIHIASGLGESKPVNIIVLPLHLDKRILGVIELALFTEITPLQQTFLEQLIGNLAVVIEFIQSRTQTEIALKKVQEASEELQVQQEELRTTNEELEEKTKILQQNEEELKTQSEELQASNEELEEKMHAIEKQSKEIEVKNAELEKTRGMLEEKANALASAGKYKTEFLSNMSHELRTPLNSLLLLSKSFASNMDGNLSTEQIEQANIIYKGGKDLLQLINDILDLSKVEAGKLNIQKEETLITEIIEDLKRQFEPLVQEKGLKFIIENKSSVSAFFTDSHRLKQIIRNLISNAIKFTKEGSVTLEISKAKQNNNDVIEFKVIDTGIGIEKNKFNDIFGAFQQAYGNTDRIYGGTGLGLTICRELARLLGGEIHLESEIGKGSTFTVILPLVHAPEAQISKQIKNMADAKPAIKHEDIQSIAEHRGDLQSLPDDRDTIAANDKVILLIDRKQELIKTLINFAKQKGYKCLTALNNETSFYLAKKYKPHGIILVLDTEDMDDVSILEKLKDDPQTKKIPLHVVSSDDTSTNTEDKAVNVLQNPLDQSTMEQLFSYFTQKDGRILLVEDEAITQKAIIDTMKAKQIEVVPVQTAKEGIEKLKTEKFDGIISDLKLPDMDGSEFLKIAKSLLNTLPPVVIYSMKDLTPEEYSDLNQYTNKIIRKEGDLSLDRLLNECLLFLHSVKKTVARTTTNNEIKMIANPDALLRDKEVLIVDDDMRNVYALSMLLKRQGMKITIATNGEEALQKMAQMQHLDIVIMDIMMPIMDGYKTMRQIRSKPEYKSLPIIAVTAKAMPDDRKACIDAGANDYVTKPVDDEKLLIMLRIWLSYTERAT